MARAPALLAATPDPPELPASRVTASAVNIARCVARAGAREMPWATTAASTTGKSRSNRNGEKAARRNMIVPTSSVAPGVAETARAGSSDGHETPVGVDARGEGGAVGGATTVAKQEPLPGLEGANSNGE